VASVLAESEEIAALVASPRRQLAFRIFASLRVGVLLGELLVDAEPRDPSRWVDELLADPRQRERVVTLIHAVGREVAADPKLTEEGESPDPKARKRLRRLLRDG
jgi:hypothetical protein